MATCGKDREGAQLQDTTVFICSYVITLVYSPPGGYLWTTIRFSCQTFKMDIERTFFTPHFDHFKPMERSEIMFSHQKSVRKAFSLYDLPQGVLLFFCQNMSQLSNLQNGHRENFFNPHLWPFLNHWKGQKSCFLIRRVLKSLFFYTTFPRGSCFAKIRVSCQTFKNGHREVFSPPIFWPF